jgi:hypothetical protein
LLRTSLYTIEAKGAIEIPEFLRLKQIQLASSVPIVAPNAIMRGARPAHGGFAHLHLQWRHESMNEVELADRTNVLAEAGALEDAVDRESRCKIA